MDNLIKAPRVYKCTTCGTRRCGKRNEICEACKMCNTQHSGAVCADCGGPATEADYSYGETKCCKAGVVAAEEFGKIDGFTN